MFPITLIIARRTADYVTIASDTRRGNINAKNGAIANTVDNTRKVFKIRPTVFLASAGLVSEHTIDTIRAIVGYQTEIATMNVMNCCIEVFRSHHAIFGKYNPNVIQTIKFIMAGKDPGTNAPFLYMFDSNREYAPASVTEAIFGNAEERARTTFAERLTDDTLDTFLNVSASTIKETSRHSQLIGDTSLLTFIDAENRCNEAWVSTNEQGVQYLNVAQLHRRLD